MTQSVVGVSTGTDKYLNSESRSIGGTAREEQIVHAGQGYIPTYTIESDDAAVNTANAHILQIMADGSNYSRLMRLWVTPTEDLPASIGHFKLALYRLTTAGTGGAALSDAPHDTADSYGGDMRRNPGTKGTEGQLLRTFYRGVDTGAQRGWAQESNLFYEAKDGTKPIIFGIADTEGIAVKVIDALASTSVLVTAEVITTAYL